MRNRHRARLTVCLGLVVLATACTGLGTHDGSTRTGARVLTKDQLRSALVAPADIGSSFTVETESRSPGYVSCLSTLFDLPDVAVPEAQVSRVTSPAQEHWPVVAQGVADYRTSAAAEVVVNRLIYELDGCDPVQFRNGKELTRAHVRTDEHRTSRSVDHQLNVSVIGTTTYDGNPRHYDIGSWFSVMRVDNHLLVTTYTDVVTEEYGYTRSLNRALLERVLAVAEGKKAPAIAPLDIQPTRPDGESASA